VRWRAESLGGPSGRIRAEEKNIIELFVQSIARTPRQVKRFELETDLNF
jgi:hypothetical protein